MSPRTCLAFTLLAAPLIAAEPPSSDPLAALEIRELLAPADMAQPIPADAWSRALLVVVTADGVYRGVNTRHPEAVTDSMSLVRLESYLMLAQSKPLPDGAPLRDSMGLSTRHVVIWPHAAAPWRAVAKAMYTCGKEELKIANVWLVGRKSDGAPGVLNVSLPRDVGIAEEAPPARRFSLSVSPEEVETAGEGASFQGREALFRAFRRLRSSHPDADLVVRIEASAGQPMLSIVAVVNEARRFGVGVVMRGVPLDADEPIEESTWYAGLESPSADAESAPPTPGKALHGDPLENPVSILPQVEEEEEG